MKARLVAPIFDDVTEYSYDWSREIPDWLKDKGYEVEDIGGRAVSKKEVENDIDSVDLFIFYNHGSEDALWGSANEAVIDLNNCGILSGKETVTMACLAAKKLGVKIYQLKGKVFTGYYQVFSFTTDALAEFKEFANSWLWHKLQGLSYKDAFDAAKKLGYDLSTKLSQAGKYIASVLMRQNADAFRCYDGEAPTTGCMVRALALKLFGRKGWFISKLRGLSAVLFLIGWGVTLHDFTYHLWQLGGYFGFAMMFIAFLLEFRDFLRTLK